MHPLSALLHPRLKLTLLTSKRILPAVFVALGFLLLYWVPIAPGIPAFLKRSWGFNTIRLHPTWTIVASALLLVAITIPQLNDRIRSHLSSQFARFGIRCSPRSTLCFAVLFLPITWFLRQKYAILGDGYAWIDGISTGRFALDSLEASRAAYPLAIRSLQSILGTDTYAAVQIWSCLLGFPYILLAGAFARACTPNADKQIVLFILLIASGIVAFFFGYGESYPPLLMATLGLAYPGLRTFDRTRPRWLPVLLALVGLLLHPLGVGLAPAALMAFAYPFDRRSLLAASAIAVILGALTALFRRDRGPYAIRIPALAANPGPALRDTLRCSHMGTNQQPDPPLPRSVPDLGSDRPAPCQDDQGRPTDTVPDPSCRPVVVCPPDLQPDTWGYWTGIWRFKRLTPSYS